jgi:hypothetical protein
MSEFTVEPKSYDLPQEDPNGGTFKNVKEIKAGDGSFYISGGKLELRDSIGNVVILMDANADT